MTKALLRKRWVFPDEMQIGFMEQEKISHSLAGKICAMKGEGRLECQQRLLLNSPDPTVPVWGTSSAKVTEWIETTLVRSPIKTKKYRPACHPHQNK
ncbi:hypothetical protein OSB04_un001454 [Centaurea solstitialis]|uniref:Uncharacterized protein n=1 Tax=Centaurea solstitialis TaxID=347529 RepID=A0AA38SAR5_9ASTR|nr:hypothetical protein OSB04_un001454 [Centaurea solstitialis]